MQFLLKLVQGAVILGAACFAAYDEGAHMFLPVLFVTTLIVWVLTAFFSSLPGWLYRTFIHSPLAHIRKASGEADRSGHTQALVRETAKEHGRLGINEDTRKLR